ncbi:Crp/Fnr family transcriptional regulator [Dyadobacter arcticus]|uniref:CRP-like cAMP-binding protein n=1 Tax=Dyadobacter arcticus TaxID=1078754 RepID=A0ABX0US43_9BACT|nr:Crp/Fnr family transcriptional regulator [Dyadobacter arcticus]NIJ54555.1 CRP-like cAMP-binding protein [Dyadobacter arcticus]
MNTLLQNHLKSQIPGLSDGELDRFVRMWTISKTIKRNELLYKAGTSENNIYFIEEGAVKICHESDEEEIIVEFGYKNSCVFNLPSFITDSPSEFYIQAIKATRLVGISKSNFLKMLVESPSLSAHWQNNLEKQLLNFAQREIDLLSKSPANRLRRLYDRKPEIFQHIPNKHIALYLGMKPETLSRLRKR